jgi:phosphoribosylformylglycinamidine cyclo-ligase/phosphoribosylamine--glycine ligase/phosphoribosylformylglycinamidine cyclo-ligase
VTATGLRLPAALRKANSAAAGIHFEGMHYRTDIGRKVDNPHGAYAQAGVSIDAGNRAVELMSQAVRSTYGPEVLAGIGAFGGLFDASALKNLADPVLVASTDGVGTKVKLAARAGSYRTIGMDLVNHCTNDILVQGARPLMFLDYFASSTLKPEIVAEVVGGIAQACREAGCALIGGETAEMPGVYLPGEFDLAGTIVGLAEKGKLIPRTNIRVGDMLVGFRSSGPHTNGYSLIRKVFETEDLDTVYPELGMSLGEALLMPHRSYLELLWPILSQEQHPIKALAHLTGGGFIENIPRVLPEGLSACIRLGTWPVLPIFDLIQKTGSISTAEMHRTFNMGIGMVAVIATEEAEAFCRALPERTWIIGEVTEGRGVFLEETE